MPSEALPFWPRYLGRVEASTYLGVCPNTFDAEVKAGMWPAPRRRGGKGGRVTWDRALLDRTADRDSGLLGESEKEVKLAVEPPDNDVAFQEALARLKSKVRGKVAARN